MHLLHVDNNLHRASPTGMPESGQCQTKGPKMPKAKATEEQIREAAYHMWLEDGAPHGDDQSYWYKAEEKLKAEKPKRAPAKKPAAKKPAAARKPAAKKAPARKAVAKPKA